MVVGLCSGSEWRLLSYLQVYWNLSFQVHRQTGRDWFEMPPESWYLLVCYFIPSKAKVPWSSVPKRDKDLITALEFDLLSVPATLTVIVMRIQVCVTTGGWLPLGPSPSLSNIKSPSIGCIINCNKLKGIILCGQNSPQSFLPTLVEKDLLQYFSVLPLFIQLSNFVWKKKYLSTSIPFPYRWPCRTKDKCWWGEDSGWFYYDCKLNFLTSGKMKARCLHCQTCSSWLFTSHAASIFKEEIRLFKLLRIKAANPRD